MTIRIIYIKYALVSYSNSTRLIGNKLNFVVVQNVYNVLMYTYNISDIYLPV